MPSALPEYRRIQHNGQPHYGQHALVTARSCNDQLLSIEVLFDFLQKMVDEIDMVSFGLPFVARFGEGIETGISGVQLIQTSAIMLHTNDAHRDMYLDVFSCKPFNTETVERVTKLFFGPKVIELEVIYRK